MRIVILAAFACLLAAPAAAIVDDGINSLGVYLDGDGNCPCGRPALYTPFNIYFILAHPTPAAIGEFEFSWRYNPPQPPNIIILEKSLPPGARNAGGDLDFRVFIAGGLPTTEATVLVRLTMMALANFPGSTFITVGPPSQPSLPGHAAFASLSDAAPAPLAFANGWVDGDGWAVPGVFVFSCGGPAATEVATWGAVKSLFRD